MQSMIKEYFIKYLLILLAICNIQTCLGKRKYERWHDAERRVIRRISTTSASSIRKIFFNHWMCTYWIRFFSKNSFSSQCKTRFVPYV